MEKTIIREESKPANQIARDQLVEWQNEIQSNAYTKDHDYIHTIHFAFPNDFERVHSAFEKFGDIVANQLEPLVNENNMAMNLPRLEEYNAMGERIDKIIHHPSYMKAGDIIYASKLLEKMATAGGLTECLSLLFLSSHTGEAGHNCPIACSAGMIRVLQKAADFPHKEMYLKKLISPSYQTNYTGAQFLTEIQGGSDVGMNTVYAKRTKGKEWQIYGEKWFCSNAGADLIFLTARYDHHVSGTKGLGLFLVPAEWEGCKNHYTLRRLKEKMGTRSMATGEIDFCGAHAIEIGSLDEGFHLVMDNVLHLSRLFNAVCVLGMAHRAYAIAKAYAKHRVAFSHPIIQYPLVKENLAKIKAENTAMIAAIFATTKMQDAFDKDKSKDHHSKLLLRLLVNLQKYFTARFSVEHIHHAIDVLAGNGMIETFSPLPRLLRDCIVCENWEGTHNILRIQILKDILKYDIEKIYIAFMHDEIQRINKETPQSKLLLTEIKKFEKEMEKFRQLDNTQQMLEIKNGVDKMVILYSALMLLIEALDQIKSDHSYSKMNCFEYFYLLHLSNDNITYDAAYINLTTKVINESN